MSENQFGIVRLQAENVKRLRAIDITPGGRHSVIICGDNEQGKSSILDAITYALTGKASCPSKPVRIGEEHASVILETTDMIVRRRWNAAGDSTLEVTSRPTEDGGLVAQFKSPQSMLDKLVGKLSFDPLSFSNMDAPKQAAALRALVGLDTRELDEKRADQYAFRTDVNRQVKQLEGQLAGMKFHDGVPEAEQSVDDLVTELNAAREHNQKITGLKTAQSRVVESLNRVDAELESCLSDIGQLKRQLAEAEDRLSGLRMRRTEVWKRSEAAAIEADSIKPIDESVIADRLRNVEATNRCVRENLAYTSIQAKLAIAKEKSEKSTAVIDKIDSQRAEMLANAKYPVDGLSFDTDGMITYRGIPFDQCSAAEKMRVSVAMAMAMNPKLPVVLIRDGSLMDNKTLKVVTDMAEEKNFQVWIEMVGEREDCTVVIEDGAVRAKSEVVAK